MVTPIRNRPTLAPHFSVKHTPLMVRMRINMTTIIKHHTIIICTPPLRNPRHAGRVPTLIQHQITNSSIPSPKPPRRGRKPRIRAHQLPATVAALHRRPTVIVKRMHKLQLLRPIPFPKNIPRPRLNIISIQTRLTLRTPLIHHIREHISETQHQSSSCSISLSIRATARPNSSVNTSRNTVLSTSGYS